MINTTIKAFLLLSLAYALPTFASDTNEYPIKVEYSNIWFWDSTKTAEDVSGNFSLEWDKDGIKTLSLNKANPNIRNFSFFTRGLYRKYLKEKIANGEDLSRGELDVLRLCLITEVCTINAYSYVFAKELGIENNFDLSTYLLHSTTKDVKENNVLSIYEKIFKMQQDFINKNDDVMRYTLANFAKRFRPANRNDIISDINKIQRNQRKDLWGRYWYNPFFANIKIQKKDVNAYDLCELDSSSFSSNWNAICRRNDLCMSNIRDIREDIDSFLKNATNGANMNELDSIDIYSRESIDKYNRMNLILFNDFPATACANKCLSGIYDAKRFYNDNETKMKESMTSFITAIGGEKIPLRFVSPHSSSLYTQITQMMKDELSESEWAEYKSSMSLVNFEELDGLFGIKP